MTNIVAAILMAVFISTVGSHDDVKAQILQPLAPKAAEQYAADSEEAAHGDPDAAYRMGESLESGRLGGLKDLAKALKFYRLAAEKGHQQAAARVAQIEAELNQSQRKEKMPSTPLGH